MLPLAHFGLAVICSICVRQSRVNNTVRYGRTSQAISAEGSQQVDDLSDQSRSSAIVAVEILVRGHDACCPPYLHIYLSLILPYHLPSRLCSASPLSGPAEHQPDPSLRLCCSVFGYSFGLNLSGPGTESPVLDDLFGLCLEHSRHNAWFTQ
jgi:hypothetical protein